MEKFPSYENFEFIGSGIFGHVLLAYDKKNDRKVAIKRTHKKGKILCKEIKIYRLIGESMYIPKLYEVFYTIGDCSLIIQNLVFEYIDSKLF